jgi:hypothetical protein
VVLDRADPAAVGHADDDGQRETTLRPVVHLGELRRDLVERREDEPVELDLADRAVPAQRETDRGADDAGLRERRVHDPVRAEVLLEPVRDPEHPAERPDVLAHEEDLGVLLERTAQAGVDRLGERDALGGHRAPPCVGANVVS